ncbi:MAG TPA: neutral zinc metallopeptidase [Gemmatimonadaceae bacterium]|nr:neutral zinc metallopeptidase [Gemmatimonadaceae bacterium]
MNRLSYLAVASALVLIGAASARHADPLRFGAVDDGPRLTLTDADVNASTQKAVAAHAALVDMWSAEFRRIGERFDAPRLARYRGTSRSACGMLPASNALYCGRSNTIYFDDVFLASQAKLAGAALGTDGDMAAVGFIAHEMGHAVTEQLGVEFRTPYAMEAAADCLAGAFARHAQQDGSLEQGDLDEAFAAMAAAANPQIGSTGNSRIDARIAARMQRMGHGTRAQRQGNFQAGFEGGGGACVDELR